MTRIIAFVTLILLVAGCATTGTGTLVTPGAEPPPFFTLFSSEGVALDDAAIQRILDSVIEIPDNARIAVLQAPSRTLTRRHYYYSGVTERELRAEQAYLDMLRSHLLPSGVREVMVLPSLLVPQEPSVPVLREMAVRLQADVLLVFQITSDIFQEYRVFRRDQFKAYATVEAILIDVRTGTIPFTTVVTREYLTQKQEGDLTNEDARRRAEQEAALQAVEQMGREVAEFITNH